MRNKLFNIDENLDACIEKAKEKYFNGKVFIYPTDTIYGFGGNPFNEDVVEKLVNIKGRDESKRFIMLVASIQVLQKYIEHEEERKIDFLAGVWPNPVTVILNLNKQSKQLFRQDTAAFRIPKHKFCLRLLEEIQMPLISTSVNKSGAPALIDLPYIKYNFLGDVDALFFSEKRSTSAASTIIDLCGSEPKLIREGKIKFEEIASKY